MAAKNTSPTSTDTAQAEYEILSGSAGSLCKEVVWQFERLIFDANATLGFPIESRVKGWPSIEEKLRRKDLELSTLAELDDLVGIRVVLLFARDVHPVLEAIRTHFDIVSIEDAQDKLGADRFGYLSNHCVIRLKPEWSKIPTFSNLPRLNVEVQIRTLAQHMWAAASHKLQYKREQAVPLPVRRTLNRVAALLETVDLEVERLLDERSDYRMAISSPQRPTPLEGDRLNVDLLETVLNELLPTDNKGADEPYDELLSELARKGITKVGPLRDLVTAWLPAAMEEEERYLSRNRSLMDQGKALVGTSEDRIRSGVYFSHVGLIRNTLSRPL